MFCNFFWSKSEECFICCSPHGKTDEEIQIEMFTCQKSNYPLVSLSHAYNCKCSNSFAHNKCLLNIRSCPTCRKNVSKPNLYVETSYDYYLWFLLDWIKKDIKRIEKIKWIGIYYICIMIMILYIFDKNKEIMHIIIPPNSYKSMCFAILIGGLYSLSLYTMVLDDYFKKYWLYNPIEKKCYIF